MVARQFNMDPGLPKVAMLNMIEPSDVERGRLQHGRAEPDRRGLKLVGEISALPDWGALIDRSFLPADLKADQ